jgi:hypothetical protein
MRMRNFYWLIGAVAIAVATVMLAALIVTLIPDDPNAVAASMQQQVPLSKLESTVESHSRGK